MVVCHYVSDKSVSVFCLHCWPSQNLMNVHRIFFKLLFVVQLLWSLTRCPIAFSLSVPERCGILPEIMDNIYCTSFLWAVYLFIWFVLLVKRLLYIIHNHHFSMATQCVPIHFERKMFTSWDEGRLQKPLLDRTLFMLGFHTRHRINQLTNTPLFH